MEEKIDEIMAQIFDLHRKIDALYEDHIEAHSTETKAKLLMANVAANLLAGTIAVPTIINLSNEPKTRNY